jgi:hypothetical protein
MIVPLECAERLNHDHELLVARRRRDLTFRHEARPILHDQNLMVLLDLKNYFVDANVIWLQKDDQMMAFHLKSWTTEMSP